MPDGSPSPAQLSKVTSGQLPVKEITKKLRGNFPRTVWLGKLPISMLPCPMQHLHYLPQADPHDRPHQAFLCTAVSSSSDVPQQQDHHQSRYFPMSFLQKHAACGKFSIAWTSCGQGAHCPQFPRTTAHCSAGVDARREQPASAEVAQLLNPPGRLNCSPVDLLHAKQTSKAAEALIWSASTNYLEKLWHLKKCEPFC